jgi:hypothetical protein
VFSLALMSLALMGRWSTSATRLSVILFGLMVVQYVLGVAGAGSSSVLGGLHTVNALLVATITVALVRQALGARHGRQSSAPTPAPKPH